MTKVSLYKIWALKTFLIFFCCLHLAHQRSQDIFLLKRSSSVALSCDTGVGMSAHLHWDFVTSYFLHARTLLALPVWYNYCAVLQRFANHRWTNLFWNRGRKYLLLTFSKIRDFLCSNFCWHDYITNVENQELKSLNIGHHFRPILLERKLIQ